MLKRTILAAFWAGRAVTYNLYFLIRSIPYRIRGYQLSLLDSKLANNDYVVRFIRVLKYMRNRTIALRNRVLLEINGDLYSIKSVTSYGGKCLVDSKVIAETELMSFTAPKFLFDLEESQDNSKNTISTREIQYRIFQNVTLIGRSEIIIADQDLILPSGYKVESDVLPIEFDGELIFSTKDQSARVSKANDSRHIEEAVHLCGSLTGNYAHWILEILPKILVIEMLDIPESCPILVDDWIHPRFIESIEFFMSKNRKIVKVAKYERIKISKIHYIDNFSYIPPQDREFVRTGIPPLPNANRFSFSTLGLSLLQSLKTSEKDEVARNRNVFVIRTEKTSGNRRQVTNMKELAQIAKEQGYLVVDPAELSFQAQVELFQNARNVITPIGAAMSNLVFSEKGCRVIGLSPRFLDGDYYFFSILNSLLGHEFQYLLGDPTSKDLSNFNSNFKIEVAQFRATLRSILLE